MELKFESSVAAWEKIGVVYDPTNPLDKAIRKKESSKAESRFETGRALPKSR